MAFKIVWTQAAEKDFKEIVDYLYDNWSLKVAENFVDKVYAKIELLENTPHVGRESEKIKSVRRILVSKHNALFDRVLEEEVVLLNIMNLGQNLKNIPY